MTLKHIMPQLLRTVARGLSHVGAAGGEFALVPPACSEGSRLKDPMRTNVSCLFSSASAHRTQRFRRDMQDKKAP